MTLTLHYQPVLDLRASRLTGYEALARWNDPELGLLAPAAFIRDAERTGAIRPLGCLILETACRDMVRWLTGRAGSDLTLSVNVSPAQLEPSFPGRVAAILTRTGLPASALMLEITESLVIPDDAGLALRELAGMGIRIALDDVGTGRSDLRAVGKHPVNVLKIDRSFVEAIAQGGAARIEEIVALARGQGLMVVAEGVATHEQLEAVRALGCDLGQGYLLGRPAAAASVSAATAG